MVKKCKKNVSPPIFKDPFFSNFEANQGASSIKRKQLLKKQKKLNFKLNTFFILKNQSSDIKMQKIALFS